jgi:hypothetical protein
LPGTADPSIIGQYLRLNFRPRAKALRPRELVQALLDHNPTIVHFSGHGAGVKGLCLEGADGRAHLPIWWRPRICLPCSRSFLLRYSASSLMPATPRCRRKRSPPKSDTLSA